MTDQRQSIIDAASYHQHQAADPSQSVWVSANAGTGKTRVLTNRVLRLLIDGANVTDILAVTYTRAAAAEMRNRLYDRLASWAVIKESDLTKDIQNIGIARPSRAQLDRSRRLFAEMLDAPIPIRIETVHAFAQSVLRRFPVEANIQPYFDLATDSQSHALKDEAIADVMASQDKLVKQSLRLVAQTMGEDQLVAAAGEMFSRPNLLKNVAEHPASIRKEIYAALDCGHLDGAADNPEAAINAVISSVVQLNPASEALLKRLAAAWAGPDAGKKGKPKAEVLQKWLAADVAGRIESFDAYYLLFLTKAGGMRDSIAVKKITEATPDFQLFADKEAARLLTALATISSIKTAQLTTAIYIVAAQMANGYGVRKSNACLMDYDDLINKTVDLFAQGGGVSWVRYKLDKGIKHLLIDEAQDTSPNQWKILSSLAEEFFENGSAEDDDGLKRSLFSVGDYKQSIYSFQGARPDLFHEQQEKFTTLARDHQKPFSAVELGTSFRTASAVLEVVDAVTRGEGIEGGAGPIYLQGLGDAAAHQVSRIGDAGFVEVLDPIEHDEIANVAPFTTFIDEGSPQSTEAILAHKIAHLLKDWIGRRYLPSRDRCMQAGDVLILLKKRGRFYQLLDREIRRLGLPLAGADRVKLTDDIAVMDLMVLGQAMLLPEDDLTLATLLKSPLFNLTEDDLFALAYDRGEDSLIRRFAASGDARIARAHTLFNTWLGHAETLTPYDFYRQVLSPSILQQFIRRLGAPVVDIIAEFLEVVRDYEDVHPPSMQGFLASMTDSSAEIKREGNAKDADEIRIMTIHGAKGLEAPVVILPDMLKENRPNQSELVELMSEGVIWPVKPVKYLVDSPLVAEAKARQNEQRDEEANRLLYVAMTRAEDGLLIAGFMEKHKRSYGNSWYELIRNAVDDHPNCQDRPDGDGVMINIEQTAPVQAQAISGEAAEPTPNYPVPSWLYEDALPDQIPPRPLSPSRYGGEHIGPSPSGQGRKQAMLRGNLTHRLLEVLPGLDEDAQKRAIARITSPIVPSQLDADIATLAIEETIALLNDDRLADIFGQQARAEVPVSGMVGHHVVSGVIDRIVIGQDSITIVDFKTGQAPSTETEIAASYISQLALYAHVLSQIWEGRTIRAGLIFTENASIYWLDDALMRASISQLIAPAS